MKTLTIVKEKLIKEGVIHSEWNDWHKQRIEFLKSIPSSITGNKRKHTKDKNKKNFPEPKLFEVEPTIEKLNYEVTIGGNAHLYNAYQLQRQVEMSVDMGQTEVLMANKKGEYKWLSILSITKI